MHSRSMKNVLEMGTQMPIDSHAVKHAGNNKGEAMRQ